MASPADRLRALLNGPEIVLMPGCFDALSAKLIEQAGFSVGFMSGFAVSGSQLALPDTGLISYGEMVEQGRRICSQVSIPMIGDGDTGFGNSINVQRTVQGYANAGFACIMIEDQVSPKRCGHTKGKAVVSREEAISRIQAAVDVKNRGCDILIMARTDARATLGLDEALARAREFVRIGADITFVEAPKSIEEMRRYCATVPGPKMANMIEQGNTPILPPRELAQLGYKIVVYPLTLLSSAIRAMQDSLAMIHQGQPADNILNFNELLDIVGFPEYYRQVDRYTA